MKKSPKILISTTVSNIDYKSLHIRIISEGLCDTEDWSNDDENSDLLQRNKFNFKVYEKINLLFYIAIFHKMTIVFCIFLIK